MRGASPVLGCEDVEFPYTALSVDRTGVQRGTRRTPGLGIFIGQTQSEGCKVRGGVAGLNFMLSF